MKTLKLEDIIYLLVGSDFCIKDENYTYLEIKDALDREVIRILPDLITENIIEPEHKYGWCQSCENVKAHVTIFVKSK